MLFLSSESFGYSTGRNASIMSHLTSSCNMRSSSMPLTVVVDLQVLMTLCASHTQS